MEAQRAKRREELRSPGAGERARERNGGRPICIVMQGAGARGRVEKVGGEGATKVETGGNEADSRAERTSRS